KEADLGISSSFISSKCKMNPPNRSIMLQTLVCGFFSSSETAIIKFLVNWLLWDLRSESLGEYLIEDGI
ncbi:MAG: hypothetical protein ACXADF_17470, partial [Candidatus Thorarchaeota archaeon]